MTTLEARLNHMKEQKEQSMRIVAFGSSNTELTWTCGGRLNWVNWLEMNLRSQIGKHVVVINHGIGGQTSPQLCARFERDVLSFQPQIVIITVGGNDAKKDVTPEQYKQYVKTMCTSLIDSGVLPVLQTYYCPIYDRLPAEYRPLFEANMEAKRELSASLNIPLIDQYHYFHPLYHEHPAQYETIMRDALHVNYLGQHLMGTIASRAFGLPDVQIPADWHAPLTKLYALIDRQG